MPCGYSTQEVNTARALWDAILRDPQSLKGTGALESIDNPPRRCNLGHACAALGAIRQITTIAELGGQHVAYHDRGDTRGLRQRHSELPPATAERLDIDTVGTLSRTITDEELTRFHIQRNDGSNPPESLAEINDETDATPTQIADFMVYAFAHNLTRPYRESRCPPDLYDATPAGEGARGVS